MGFVVNQTRSPERPTILQSPNSRTSSSHRRVDVINLPILVPFNNGLWRYERSNYIRMPKSWQICDCSQCILFEDLPFCWKNGNCNCAYCSESGGGCAILSHCDQCKEWGPVMVFEAYDKFWGWYCGPCEEEWDECYHNQESWDVWRYHQYVFGIRNKVVSTRRALLVSRTALKNLPMIKVMSTDVFTELIAAYSCNNRYYSVARVSSQPDTITFRLHKYTIRDIIITA